MEEYYKTRTRAEPVLTTNPLTSTAAEDQMSEFDRHRQSLITEDEDEGWKAELRRYLKSVPAEVTKDTDIVTWWQVRIPFDR